MKLFGAEVNLTLFAFDKQVKMFESVKGLKSELSGKWEKLFSWAEISKSETNVWILFPCSHKDVDFKSAN